MHAAAKKINDLLFLFIRVASKNRIQLVKIGTHFSLSTLLDLVLNLSMGSLLCPTILLMFIEY